MPSWSVISPQTNPGRAQRQSVTTVDTLWRHDPGLRGLSASEDGSECDGWRRELGADEVCENYMDAKFGGEVADMAESQRS